MGWIPVHFWEKQVKKDLSGCADKIIDIIQIIFAESIEL